MTRESDRKILSRYVPENTVEQVLDLLYDKKINLSIKKARATKLGDFKPPVNGLPARLSINGDLNPYSFLITLIHEIAHWHVWEVYKKLGRVSPHGIEWKTTFQELMMPFLNDNTFPPKILVLLKKHMRNPKASTTSDVQLIRALKEFDTNESEISMVVDLKVGDSFILKGKHFTILKKNRSRYLCQEKNTSRKFLVHSLAEISIYNKD